MKDVPKDFPLAKNQRFQVDSHLQNISIINREAINDFLDDLSDTLYYLDFETYQLAVPEYIKMHAYQQVPFQYSVHIENNGQIHHHEFLAENNKDPREPFIQSLINNMGTNGDIIVYNISFERSILKSLIKRYPNYKVELQLIINRMKDLMIPFKKRWYYVPNMKGSYSIKDVLPALLPDLTYAQLEINDGSIAGINYLSLNNNKNKSQNNDIRRNLLEYCKMDTFAMVKILEVLRKL